MALGVVHQPVTNDFTKLRLALPTFRAYLGRAGSGQRLQSVILRTPFSSCVGLSPEHSELGSSVRHLEPRLGFGATLR